jgi:hypothetical protein
MKHLIVLTPRAAAVQLLTFLQHLNGVLRCHAVDSLSSLRSLSRQCGDAARLISFGTDILVPGDVLKRIRYGSYNFHPGPPCYPGWAPASFAIMDDALTFGATAHLMVEKIDAGPIIGTELFPVPPEITADLLAAEATRATGRLLPASGRFWPGKRSLCRACRSAEARIAAAAPSSPICARRPTDSAKRNCSAIAAPFCGPA